ncbi:MAG TPA: hypothetical protein VGC62_01820 [Pseudomonas sp.]|uniref:hypothetical protein n=1 Tax=Pseudomonas sp. TaxID=306 RepID=UPI002ED92DCC
MQSSQQPEDDGLIVMQRLKPDQIDVVLGSHPGKRAAVHSKSGWSLTRVVIFLILLGVGGYLLAQLFHSPRSVAKPTTLESSIMPATDDTTPTAPAPEVIRTTEQVVYIAPKLEVAAPTAKSLDHCLKDGNVIDQDVVNCRFGEAPRTDSTSSRPQGMVSDRYMADYKSAADKTKTEPRGKQYQVAGVFIRGIDDRNRYEARYRIYNNHIETSSVCMNFASDSVEYRECRRAAVPFFKDTCSDWTKRFAKDRDDKSKLAQEQYCEAARAYQP